MIKLPEYVYDNFWTSEDGEHVCYYEIYEKNGEKYVFVDASTRYFDTLKECQEEAEKHIDSLTQGGNKKWI